MLFFQLFRRLWIFFNNIIISYSNILSILISKFSDVICLFSKFTITLLKNFDSNVDELYSAKSEKTYIVDFPSELISPLTLSKFSTFLFNLFVLPDVANILYLLPFTSVVRYSTSFTIFIIHLFSF